MHAIKVLSLLTVASTLGCGLNTPASQLTLQEAMDKYESLEGPQTRGIYFEIVTRHLDEAMSSGTIINRSEILAKFNTPDYRWRDANTTGDVYLYDRFGKRDWFVLIAYNNRGQVNEFGYNATSELNNDVLFETKGE